MATSLLKKGDGFTLMEILISITIISLIGIVFFPNLRKFNSDQQYQNEVLNIKNSLKSAQNMYTTGTKCGNSKPAIAWSVYFTIGSPITSRLKGYCVDSSLTASNELFPIANVSSLNYVTSTSTCGSATAIELKFDKNGLSYSCNDNNIFTKGSFSLTLQNKNNTAQSSTILINQLGTISQN